MDTASSSVTAERERKRQKRSFRSISDCLSSASADPSTSRTDSSTPTAVALTPTPSTILGRQVVSPKPSDQAEVKMASSTPVDSCNMRGIRSKACLDLLEGDHFTIRSGLEKRWVLPRRLLDSHSPYFARIPSEGKSFLPLGEEEAFELFAQWLYLGELDLDGVDFASEFLVKAWCLGDRFECPTFKDHVMVQLIKSHHERGIDPLRFRHIFESANSGSKLRKWAIDQFHAKLTYGYTGYDNHMNGDHPNDKAHWKKCATDLKHFSQDFLGACLDAVQGVSRVKKPWENGQQYMEVLKYAEIGVCKEEGTSVKTEATPKKEARR